MTNIIIYYGTDKKKINLIPKYLLLHLSPVISNIVKEKNEIIIDDTLFNEKDVEFLFNNLLLYPYYQPSYYKSFNELKENLQLCQLTEIIKYYQLKNTLYIIHDLLNSTEFVKLNLENFKAYFELKSFFKMDKLNLSFFGLHINNFLIKNIFDKELLLENLDDHTKSFLIDFILNKIKKKPYFGYTIELDYDLN